MSKFFLYISLGFLNILLISCNTKGDLKIDKTLTDIPDTLMKYFLPFETGDYWIYLNTSIDSAFQYDTVKVMSITEKNSETEQNVTIKKLSVLESSLHRKLFIDIMPTSVFIYEEFDSDRLKEIHYYNYQNKSFTTDFPVSLEVIDSLNVNGQTYINVLHSRYAESRYLKELWIAPRIGIVKKITNNGEYNLIKHSI